jgi:hypothetical protein
MRRYITDDAADSIQGPESINSIQNGILLRADIHSRFDSYQFGVNPDASHIIPHFL